MSAATDRQLRPDEVRPAVPGRWAFVAHVLRRKYLVFQNSRVAFVTGFLEAPMYLLSIGVGVGALVGSISFGGRAVEYVDFVAPAMLATAAMNGALFDSTYNFFHYLKFDRLYEQWLATPLGPGDIVRGELAWTLVRGGAYSLFFWVAMVALGMTSSPLAVLALPAALLVTAAFAAVGMALTTYMRSFQDFDYITLATMPMLLFSGTFFPVGELPDAVRWVVEATPLYRGVVLCRELCLGQVGAGSAVSVVYLVLLAAVSLVVVRRRVATLLLS